MSLRRCLLAAGFALIASCRSAQVPMPDLSRAAGSVSRGEYLVRNAAVCGHCHAADPKRDPDGPLSGGMEFRNWRIGTARASNLTSDPSTGLGAWSEAEIARALRNGLSRDGRLLAPVMPYEWLHEMSDADALSVARYLASLAPVKYEVKQSPNLIFRFARAFILGPKASGSPSAPTETVAYGGYLARIGLCADCHSPRRGIRSLPDRSRLFAGTSNPPEGFPANPSNLTPDRETGIGSWSESDFIRTLRSGRRPDGRQLHSFMPWRQIGRMSDDDLRAMYRYLQALPPIRNAVVVRRQ